MRLIDADSIQYTMLYKENWLKGAGVEAQAVWKKDIDAMPTVDAVPVIRCKDCKFSVDEYQDGDCYCRRTNRPLEWIGDCDFFCADGAKMEIEHETI